MVVKIKLNLSIVLIITYNLLNGVDLLESLSSDTKANSLHKRRLTGTVTFLVVSVILVLAKDNGGHVLIYIVLQLLKSTDISCFNALQVPHSYSSSPYFKANKITIAPRTIRQNITWIAPKIW